MPSTHNSYAEIIGLYIDKNFSKRGIEVFSEIHVGTSLIGTRRSIDLLVREAKTEKVFGIECKFQATSGSAQEKLIYALEDLQNLRIPACLVYAGEGFSQEIRSHLMRSPWAAYCLPPQDLSRYAVSPSRKKAAPLSTQQLDLSLAIYFDWWDILLGDKEKIKYIEQKSNILYKNLAPLLPVGDSPETSIMNEDLKSRKNF